MVTKRLLPRALESRLAATRMPIAMAVVAFVLGLPSLRLGLALDDHWHRAMLQHDTRWIPATRAPWDVFTLVRSGGLERDAIIEKGMLPWWITEDVHVAFFRPVSSLTHALDYALWPSSPALMHLVSLLWYAALVFVAAVVFRRFLGRTNAAAWVAGLAALLYAVDGTHGLPVGWIANRNAILAATFGFAALYAHDARRPFLASVLVALALGSGESGAGVLAYFAAHALFIDARPRAARLRALVPVALVTLAWAVIHRVGDYGVRGSSIYVDPKRDPVQFVANFVNLPILTGAELGGPSPDLFPFAPFAAKAFLMSFALVMIALAAFAGRKLLAREHPRSSVARFFLAGGLLALVPSCSVIPSARLLLVASFGLVGYLAMLAEEQTKAARRYSLWAVGVRLLLSPLMFTLHEHQMAFAAGRVEMFARGIPNDASVVDKRLVLLNAPDSAFAYYMIVNRASRDEPAPQAMLTIAGGYRDVTITRTGPNTLVVRVAEGFYRRHTDILFRARDEITPVGKRIVTSDSTITTTHALPDGVIDEVRCELREPLEDAHWLIMEWHGGALEPAKLPAIGETRTLAGTPMF